MYCERPGGEVGVVLVPETRGIEFFQNYILESPQVVHGWVINALVCSTRSATGHI